MHQKASTYTMSMWEPPRKLHFVRKMLQYARQIMISYSCKWNLIFSWGERWNVPINSALPRWMEHRLSPSWKYLYHCTKHSLFVRYTLYYAFTVFLESFTVFWELKQRIGWLCTETSCATYMYSLNFTHGHAMNFTQAAEAWLQHQNGYIVCVNRICCQTSWCDWFIIHVRHEMEDFQDYNIYFCPYFIYLFIFIVIIHICYF